MAERPSQAIKLTNKLQDSDNVAVLSIAAHHHHAPPASHTQGDPSVSVIEILDDDNMIDSATSRDAEVAREGIFGFILAFVLTLEDISKAGWDKKLGINDEDESDYE
ncbi:hypothetical protein H0H87_000676 [Tephrocybe sp. NHM501043]|nr:hypothetical protein H0H87_000676 [Tephrocybe sp. NHM501043]